MSTKTKAKRTDADERLYKALSHPIRHDILIKLNERPASPSQLADQLGQPIGNVAYHVRTLVDLDAIELVEVRPVRGALEHVYRATTRAFIDDDHWARLPLSVREQFTDKALQGIWEHVVEATQAGGFNAPDKHVSWTTVELDADGRQEMAALLAETLETALDIHGRSVGRLAELGEDEREAERSELAILHYSRPRTPDE